jgi:hypothetical protein
MLMFNANDAGPTCACQKDKYGPDTPALLASTSDSAVAPRSAIDPNPASSAACTFQPPSSADDAPATTDAPRLACAPRAADADADTNADDDTPRAGAARRARTARGRRPRTSAAARTTTTDGDADADALVVVVIARRGGAVDGNVARACIVAIVTIVIVVVVANTPFRASSSAYPTPVECRRTFPPNDG